MAGIEGLGDSGDDYTPLFHEIKNEYDNKGSFGNFIKPAFQGLGHEVKWIQVGSSQLDKSHLLTLIEKVGSVFSDNEKLLDAFYHELVIKAPDEEILSRINKVKNSENNEQIGRIDTLAIGGKEGEGWLSWGWKKAAAVADLGLGALEGIGRKAAGFILPTRTSTAKQAPKADENPVDWKGAESVDFTREMTEEIEHFRRAGGYLIQRKRKLVSQKGSKQAEALKAEGKLNEAEKVEEEYQYQVVELHKQFYAGIEQIRDHYRGKEVAAFKEKMGQDISDEELKLGVGRIQQKYEQMDLLAIGNKGTILEKAVKQVGHVLGESMPEIVPLSYAWRDWQVKYDDAYAIDVVKDAKEQLEKYYANEGLDILNEIYWIEQKTRQEVVALKEKGGNEAADVRQKVGDAAAQEKKDAIAQRVNKIKEKYQEPKLRDFQQAMQKAVDDAKSRINQDILEFAKSKKDEIKKIREAGGELQANRMRERLDIEIGQRIGARDSILAEHEEQLKRDLARIDDTYNKMGEEGFWQSLFQEVEGWGASKVIDKYLGPYFRKKGMNELGEVLKVIMASPKVRAELHKLSMEELASLPGLLNELVNKGLSQLESEVMKEHLGDLLEALAKDQPEGEKAKALKGLGGAIIEGFKQDYVQEKIGGKALVWVYQSGLEFRKSLPPPTLELIFNVFKNVISQIIAFIKAGGVVKRKGRQEWLGGILADLLPKEVPGLEDSRKARAKTVNDIIKKVFFGEQEECRFARKALGSAVDGFLGAPKGLGVRGVNLIGWFFYGRPSEELPESLPLLVEEIESFLSGDLGAGNERAGG